MRFNYFIFFFILLSSSCTQKTSFEKEPVEEHIVKESSRSKVKLVESVADDKPDSTTQEFYNLLSKAIETFPNDSASFNSFFLRHFQPESEEKILRQNKRIASYLEEGFVSQYTEVSNELKPLMDSVVQADRISRSQLERLVYLYSFYDAGRGSAMFSNLLTVDEHYGLVWESFRIMAAYNRDTSGISSLIELDNAIRTNAELGQAMQGFIHQAILNNPEGYLEMYALRGEEEKEYFAEHCKLWDTTVDEMIAMFEDISSNSPIPNHRILAKSLLEYISE